MLSDVPLINIHEVCLHPNLTPKTFDILVRVLQVLLCVLVCDTVVTSQYNTEKSMLEERLRDD